MSSIERIALRFCNAKLLNSDTNKANRFTAAAITSTVPNATTARDMAPSAAMYEKLSTTAVAPSGSMMFTTGIAIAATSKANDRTNSN